MIRVLEEADEVAQAESWAPDRGLCGAREALMRRHAEHSGSG